MRILWAFTLLATIVSTSDFYNILKKSNAGFLRFLRFPVAVCYPAAFIYAYHTWADTLTLSDIQMYLNLMRELANILVRLAFQLFWETSHAKAFLLESLLITRIIEMAGSLIFHSPKENEQAIMKFSFTRFLVHWALMLVFILWGCILMLAANVGDHFVLCVNHGVNILLGIGILVSIDYFISFICLQDGIFMLICLMGSQWVLDSRSNMPESLHPASIKRHLIHPILTRSKMLCNIRSRSCCGIDRWSSVSAQVPRGFWTEEALRRKA